MYIVVFFLLLWTLFQVVLSHKAVDESNTIHLIAPKNSYIHQFSNNQFIGIYKYELRHSGFMDIKPVKCDCENVRDTIQIQRTMNLRYVINLLVTDFYQTDYNEVLDSGFLWAGDVNDINKTFEICKKTSLTRKWKTETVETCEPSNETTSTIGAKLVSEAVSENQFLMNLVYNFGTEYDPHTYYTVLICSDTNIDLREQDGINIIQSSFDCSLQRENQVIAIVAPNSKTISDLDTFKPIIFFDKNISKAEAGFRNAIYLKSRSYKHLAEDFFWFIRQMGWSRVAVISDGSEESLEFEEELKSVFKMAASWLSYTNREVIETTQGLDFTTALESLKQAEAKIIIANVAEEHAVTLANVAQKLAMNHLTVWIAREWSGQTVFKVAQHINTVYSVGTDLKPALEASVNAIQKAIRNVRGNYHLLDHRRFAGDIERHLKWEPKNHITLTKGRRSNQLIAVDRQWQPNTPERFPDRYADCTLKTLNFYRHCDDMVLIYLLLVVAVFAITVLGITYFFTTPDTPYNRMKN